MKAPHCLRISFFSVACGFAATTMAGTLEAQVLDDLHVDLNIGYQTGKFSLGPRDDEDGIQYGPQEAVMYVSSAAKRTRTGNEVGDFSFIGVDVGQSYWRLGQTQSVGVLFLGWAGYGIASGALDSYDPSVESNGRVTGNGAWSRVRLESVVGPGKFSIWQSVVGGLKLFMSNTDGVDGNDALWALTGSHAHYNTGLTQTGCYDVQFRISGYENNSGSGLGPIMMSPLITLHYGVEVFPAPIHGTLRLTDYVGDPERQTVTAKLFQSGVLKETRTVRLQSAIDGEPGECTFALSTGLRGTYDLLLKTDTGLSKSVPGITIMETANSVAVDLGPLNSIDLPIILGDCDNSDYINTDDYLILSGAFDTGIGDSSFDARADLDGNQYVNTDDYLILSSHFDLGGEG